MDNMLSSLQNGTEYELPNACDIVMAFPALPKIVEEVSVSLGVICSFSTSVFCPLITEFFKDLAFCCCYST